MSCALASWQTLAACKGADPKLFFPTRGEGANHGADAKAICQSCPVRLECLTAALDRNEDRGIWGGAGESVRRPLLRAWRTRSHETLFRPRCKCDSCVAIREHFARLDGKLEGPAHTNGAGARHGARSTRARGCRCAACNFANSVLGHRLTAVGLDTAAWWWGYFRWRNDGPTLADRARELASADIDATAEYNLMALALLQDRLLEISQRQVS